MGRKVASREQKPQTTQNAAPRPTNGALSRLAEAPAIRLSVVVVLCGVLVFFLRDRGDFNELRERIAYLGGHTECVKVAVVDGLRNLVSTCDSNPGTDLVSIPERAMLSTRTSNQKILDLAEEIGGFNPDSQDAEAILLTLVVLHELARGAKSPFASFLSSWPKVAPDILALGDELQMNAVAVMLPTARVRSQEMQELIESFTSAAPGLFGSPSKATQRRVFACVMSRGHTYRLTPKVWGHVLLPFMDQVNHNAEKSNAKFQCDKRGCKLVAVERIHEGETIVHNYGAKPDLGMLFTYGFAPGGNLSTLRVPLGTALGHTAIKDCGDVISLDHGANFTVPAEVMECFTKISGPRRFLEALQLACGDISKRMSRGSVTTSYGPAGTSVVEALHNLESRRPHQALDAGIITAVRREMTTVNRCIDETTTALKNMRSSS